MYWFGFPAILKGWFDMCIIDQVAVDICKTKWMDNGLFKGKKLLISMTTGAKHAAFTSFGDHGDIDVYMWPLMMPFRFCGFAVLPPQIFYEVQQVSHERRTEMLTSWKERLETIFNETPLSFVHVENFGRDAILKTEVLESQSENEEGFNIAQHMGKRVPNGRKVEL